MSGAASPHGSLDPTAPRARVARVVHGTFAEGPWLRTAIWMRGCTLRCPGCCNPELFDQAPAEDDPTIETFVRACITDALAAGVEGLTLVGGEPLQQLELTTALCIAARTAALGSIVFTGYEHDELANKPGLAALREVVDTLVVGRFDGRRIERDGRAFVGSTNQTLVHVTTRYDDPALWSGGEVAELRLDGDVLGLVGGAGLVRKLATGLR